MKIASVRNIAYLIASLFLALLCINSVFVSAAPAKPKDEVKPYVITLLDNARKEEDFDELIKHLTSKNRNVTEPTFETFIKFMVAPLSDEDGTLSLGRIYIDFNGFSQGIGGASDEGKVQDRKHRFG